VVSKCANPNCFMPFRYLREGTLFLFDTNYCSELPVDVRDMGVDHASLAFSCGDPTLSPNSEEPASGKSGRATLEGEHLSEFIDLLVRKGVRVAIQIENRR